MDSIPHGTRSGYSYHKCRCEVCVTFKKAADRDYYERNRERIKARSHAAYHADPAAVQQRRRTLAAALSEEERQRRKVRDAEWAKTPDQRAMAYARAQKYARSDKGKAAFRRSVAKRRGAPFTAEAVEYVEILLDDPCAYCGAGAGEIDHILSIASAGVGDWDNLTAACRSCNARKHTKDLLHFLLERRSDERSSG